MMREMKQKKFKLFRVSMIAWVASSIVCRCDSWSQEIHQLGPQSVRPKLGFRSFSDENSPEKPSARRLIRVKAGVLWVMLDLIRQTKHLTSLFILGSDSGFDSKRKHLVERANSRRRINSFRFQCRSPIRCQCCESQKQMRDYRPKPRSHTSSKLHSSAICRAMREKKISQNSQLPRRRSL